MSKQAILVLGTIVVVAVVWLSIRHDDDGDMLVETGMQEPPAARETNRMPGEIGETESYGSRSESMPESAGMSGSPGAASTEGPSTGSGQSAQIPPEGLPGDAQLPMGPAPEASDTGIMGPAPEAGDTGITGPAPEADAIIMETQPPEFGQATGAGSPPEASGTP